MVSLRFGTDLNVNILRIQHPDWNWTPIRHLFGYSYRGTKGDRVVQVERCASLHDEVSHWRVRENECSTPYIGWVPDGKSVTN